MLEIKNLTANIDDKTILNGIDLVVPDGEIHAIMGPNGSGKSTLSYVLSGREGYEVTGGSATFDGADLLDMEPEARAAAGLFLAFQYPVELPGVNNANFLRTALNAQRRARERRLDPRQWRNIEKIAASVPRWRHVETLDYVRKIDVNITRLDDRGRIMKAGATVRGLKR